MREKPKVNCDQCGADLTYTSNAVDYYLVLDSENKLPWYVREGLSSGAVTMMAKYPAVSHPHHFCGLVCLAKWAKDTVPNVQDNYEKQMKRREIMEARNNPNPSSERTE